MSEPACHLLPEAEIEAIVCGRHGDPFAVLGPHGDDPPVVRTFQPEAERVFVLDATTGERLAELERLHPEGLFAGTIRNRRGRLGPYRLLLLSADREWVIEDPYRFPLLLGELDLWLLAEGSDLRLYEKLGAHPDVIEGVRGTRFAVWAPSAKRVSVVGDFNAWDGRRHPMRRRVEAGVWEIFLPGVGPGARYMYEILGPGGERLPLKADPLAFFCERPPGTASIVHGLPRPVRTEEAWRAQRNDRRAPIAIYECHATSWRRVPEEGDRWLTWPELAERLVPYVVEMGFTHLELLPISEYPFDGSWGYQPIGLYAPTSRLGSPEDFARFVEACHRAGLGLLLDWVPAHFPADPHGLARFDGTALYEHEDPRRGWHPDWHTLIYNYGRREVANFLLANALFWLDRYGVDGLRVDAVASMLYLDYSRPPGEWLPNIFGGRENLEAVAFLRRMNEVVFGRHPGATTIAEESTAWPMVSRPTWLGGLGFGYKWNLGWMHDTLRYLSTDPLFRKYRHDDLTFGLLYAFSENFVLPLSHDEVVHGKGSLLARMPGDRWQKFANLRACYGFMWTYPGKKLLFMGSEFAQEREWNATQSLDWHLLADPLHQGIQRLVRDLNHLYRELPALHELDCEPAGFEWIDHADVDHSVLVFARRGCDPASCVVVVCNFTPVVRFPYRIGVPRPGRWQERLNTDDPAYGGSGVAAGGLLTSEDIAWHGRPQSLVLTLPPLAVVVLEPVA
ncbi:1,4-alpha-glucan branching enzyme GlgB [bacterium HR40]|nr:1,4-alpha-glucan branching enzyme GlgB [bacterium HR40]